MRRRKSAVMDPDFDVSGAATLYCDMRMHGGVSLVFLGDMLLAKVACGSNICTYVAIACHPALKTSDRRCQWFEKVTMF